MTSNGQRLRIGTRASALARWQADWVAARLTELGAEVQLVPITTRGDARRGEAIGALGETGVFTKEIQNALLAGQIDVAVHSLKDLPTEPIPGLTLAAVPPREVAGDALIARQADSLKALPHGAVIGTGSLRRRAQLLHIRPDLVMRDLRGNIDTRLAKLDRGDFAAIVLAEAGLRRLGLFDRATQVFSTDIMLPAVGQGALGIETRADDARTLALVSRLDHSESRYAVIAERTLLAELQGGCLAPIGALGRAEGGQLSLIATVLSPDGKTKLIAQADGPLQTATDLGHHVAQQLLTQGAADLMRSPH